MAPNFTSWLPLSSLYAHCNALLYQRTQHTSLWQETENPYKDTKWLLVLFREVYIPFLESPEVSFPLLNALSIKWASIKEVNPTACGVASLSHCFTNKLSFTLNSVLARFNSLMSCAKNAQWILDLLSQDPWNAWLIEMGWAFED